MVNDFTMYAGETKYLDTTISDADKRKLLDLTGSSLAWTLKANGNVAVTKTTSNGIAITNGANGQCTVTLLPTDTADLNGEYIHQLKVTDSYGNVSVVLQGTITINPAN